MKGLSRSRLRSACRQVASHQATHVGLLLSAVVVAVILALGPLAWVIAGETVRGLPDKDRAAAMNAVRQTVLTAFGGAAALVAIGFTVRTYYLSKRGQVTDRFRSAVSQLASSEMEERIGGIHALEQVMIESSRDHAAVLGVLCMFLRRRTLIPAGERHSRGVPDFGPLPDLREEPEFDVDAAMTALARRPERPEPNRPDLRDMRLPNLSVRSHDFARRPRLTRMFLTRSDFRCADLRGADFRGTIANDADFQGAWIAEADLRRASFSRSNMRKVNFTNARLAGAIFAEADLRGAVGLTAAQLSEAFIDSTTRLSEDLVGDDWVMARLADCTTVESTGPWFCPPRTPAPAG